MIDPNKFGPVEVTETTLNTATLRLHRDRTDFTADHFQVGKLIMYNVVDFNNLNLVILKGECVHFNICIIHFKMNDLYLEIHFAGF